MYISSIHIKNYRNFRDCVIPFNKGLSVIIGENNIGKTNLLAALSLLFSPDASRRSRHLSIEDFCVDIPAEEYPPEVEISCTLAGLDSVADKAVAASWMTRNPLEARVTYKFRCGAKARTQYTTSQPIPIADYEWVIYGGETESRDHFEFDQLQKISLEQLGALRDAERDLLPGARGRVQALIRRYGVSQQDKESIEASINSLNTTLTQASQLRSAEQAINEKVYAVAGSSNAQPARLVPVGANYEDLLRSIKIMVQSAGADFRDISWNGLGYNNLLFISVLLAEHLEGWREKNLILPIMAVEEPEAHLHPHLQTLLNRNLGETVAGAQIIATTHSTHIASSVSLDSLVVLNREEGSSLQAVRVGTVFGSSDVHYKKDLERYLDATKSTLFFAKSVLLVEGLSEALLLPVFAQKCMKPPIDLDEKGISVVAVHGLAFRAFLPLFEESAIRRRCAVLTDADSKTYPLCAADARLGAVAQGLVADCDKNPYVSVFTSLETFEYDLAIATRGSESDSHAPLANEKYIIRALHNTHGITKASIPHEGEFTDRRAFGKAVAGLVEGAKGRFAQALAKQVEEDSTTEGFVIPAYIRDALGFLLEVPDGAG